MKIALCFRGMVGYNKGFKKWDNNKHSELEYLDPELPFQFYKKNLLDSNKEHEIDIFMHSWSVNHEEKLLDLYKPKKSVFEKQIQFSTIRKDKNEKKEFAHRSMYYSTKCSVELKKQYEKENNFTYDIVMILRYDTVFTFPFLFSAFEDENLRDSFYTLETFLPKEQVADHWFMSSSKNIDKYCEISNNYEKYCGNENEQLASPHIQQYQHIKSFIKEENIYRIQRPAFSPLQRYFEGYDKDGGRLSIHENFHQAMANLTTEDHFDYYEIDVVHDRKGSDDTSVDIRSITNSTARGKIYGRLLLFFIINYKIVNVTVYDARQKIYDYAGATDTNKTAVLISFYKDLNLNLPSNIKNDFSHVKDDISGSKEFQEIANHYISISADDTIRTAKQIIEHGNISHRGTWSL